MAVNFLPVHNVLRTHKSFLCGPFCGEASQIFYENGGQVQMCALYSDSKGGRSRKATGQGFDRDWMNEVTLATKNIYRKSSNKHIISPRGRIRVWGLIRGGGGLISFSSKFDIKTTKFS